MTRRSAKSFPERIKDKITGIPNDLKDMVNYFTKPNPFKSRFMQSLPGSLTLIFSVTTTLTGSTLLTMPYGFQQSGFIIGTIIFVVEALLSFYTCFLIMTHSINHRKILVDERLEQFKQTQGRKSPSSLDAEHSSEAINIPRSTSGTITPPTANGDNYQANPNLNLNLNLYKVDPSRTSLDVPTSKTPDNMSPVTSPRSLSDSDIEKPIMETPQNFRFDPVSGDTVDTNKARKVLHHWVPFLFVWCCIPKSWRISKMRFPKVVTPNDLTYPHIMKMYFGPWVDALSLFVSVFILIGAAIAYHIFLKDSLMSLVSIFFQKAKDQPDPFYWCDISVALYIIIVMFPVLCLKDVGIIKKINSFGFVFLITNLTVMVLLSVQMFLESFGIYFPFLELLSSPDQPAQTSAPAPGIATAIVNLRDGDAPQKKNTFALMGILSLSFFIHNIISQFVTDAKVDSIKKKATTAKGSAVNAQEFDEKYFTADSATDLPESSKGVVPSVPLQANPHVIVDVGIAFFLAAMLYFLPGICGSVAYTFKYEINLKPGMKVPKMQGNYLNLFSSRNILAIISRVCVLLQLGSIYPLLVSVIREQVFVSVLGKVPSFIGFHIFISFIVAVITTSFAAFYPNVGAVLSYTGAFCGLFWLYLFPVGIELLSKIVDKSLPWYILIFWGAFNLIIASFGFVILITQFLPSF